MRFKQFLSKRLLLIKLVLSYVVTGSILMGIFSVIIINSITGNTIKQVKKTDQGILVQSISTMKATVDFTYKFFLQMVFGGNTDGQIFNALYANEFSRTEIWEIVKRLEDYVKVNQMIYSIYIYNPEADLVFCSGRPASSVREFFDKEVFEFVGQNENTMRKFIPRVINDPKDNTKKKVLSFVIREAVNGVGVPNAIIVNLDQERFQQTVFDPNNMERDYLAIIDSRGRVLTDSPNIPFGQDISNYDYVKQILNSQEKEGSINAKIGKEDVLVSYCKDTNYQWSFIVGSDYNAITGNKNIPIRSIGTVAIMFILISLGLAGVFVFIFYRPMGKLLQKIGGADSEDRNIYNLVTNMLNKLKGDVYRFEKSQKAQVLKQLCYGEFLNEYELNEQIRKININLVGKKYRAMLFQLNSYSLISQDMSSADLALVRYALSNIAEEILSENFSTEILDEGEASVVAIIAYDHEAIETLKNAIAKIQFNIEKYFNIHFSAFIGNDVKNLYNISESYKAALEVSAYKLLFGKDAIVTEDDIQQMKGQQYSYPFEIENKIIDDFKQWDYDAIEKHVCEFMDYIKTFPYNGIQLSLVYLLMTTIKQTIKMTDISRLGIDTEYSAIVEKIQSRHTIEELTEWLLSIYKNIIDSLKSKLNNKNAAIAESIKKFIEENYKDPALSIDMISNHVKLSPNYARILFKEQMGISISEYISQKRFDTACRLLLETGYSVKKIAEMSGFSTTGYFFSAFKKKTGQTPEQYRKNGGTLLKI